MYGIMLGTSPQFSVLGRFRSLQTFHHLHTHDRSQVGVLTVGFLSPAPSWVAEDVDVGCPHREAVEFLVLTRATLHTLVVLGTEFR